MRNYCTVRANGQLYRSVQYEKTRDTVRIDYPGATHVAGDVFSDGGMAETYTVNGKPTIAIWVSE
jgi:hypothetical protein